MRINIAERLKPFSHSPGTYFILPGTSLRFQIFPALVRVHNLFNAEPQFITEIQLNIKGPVLDFTAQQDLEHGCLQIWGHTSTGFLHYQIHALKDYKNFAIVFEKVPNDEFNISCSNNYIPNKPQNIKPKDTLVIAKHETAIEKDHLYKPESLEKISFGCHKAQDWELIKRRLDLSEILPLWFKFGNLIPKQDTKAPHEGTAFLLEQCNQAIAQSDRLAILPAFRNLFLAGFEGGFSPQLIDNQHQGYKLPKIESEFSPLVLLSEGSSLIRSLLLQSDENEILVLPVLPPEFHCGRFLNACCGNLGIIDMEWSKKQTRRMIFKAKSTSSVTFHFQKDIKQFRLRRSHSERGTVLESGKTINIESESIYFLDNFMK